MNKSLIAYFLCKYLYKVHASSRQVSKFLSIFFALHEILIVSLNGLNLISAFTCQGPVSKLASSPSALQAGKHLPAAHTYYVLRNIFSKQTLIKGRQSKTHTHVHEATLGVNTRVCIINQLKRNEESGHRDNGAQVVSAACNSVYSPAHGRKYSAMHKKIWNKREAAPVRNGNARAAFSARCFEGCENDNNLCVCVHVFVCLL